LTEVALFNLRKKKQADKHEMGNLKEFWMTQIQHFDIESTVEQMEK